MTRVDRQHARVLVVIPAYNEEATVGPVIREVLAALPSAQVLVVDDGSSDDTKAAALSAGASVARLPFNLGVGGAMRTGFRYAYERDVDVVVQVDADGQHDPRYLGPMLDALGSADLVVGARFAGEGDYAATGPRKLAMVLLSWILTRVLRTPISDATSGFRASGRRAIRVYAHNYPAEYLGDTLETLVIARKVGLRVRQVPVAMRPRAGGQASQSFVGATVYLCRAFGAIALALVRRWPVPGGLE